MHDQKAHKRLRNYWRNPMQVWFTLIQCLSVSYVKLLMLWLWQLLIKDQRCRKTFEAGVLRWKANSPAGPLGAQDADENLKIVWHKIIGNFTFVNTLMIPIKQYNDCIHTYSYIQHLQFIIDYDPL